jgi:magnesium chelatase accessory protein
VPTADLVVLKGLGHLAHEEAPERVAELILERSRMPGLIEEESS